MLDKIIFDVRWRGRIESNFRSKVEREVKQKRNTLSSSFDLIATCNLLRDFLSSIQESNFLLAFSTVSSAVSARGFRRRKFESHD